MKKILFFFVLISSSISSQTLETDFNDLLQFSNKDSLASFFDVIDNFNFRKSLKANFQGNKKELLKNRFLDKGTVFLVFKSQNKQEEIMTLKDRNEKVKFSTSGIEGLNEKIIPIDSKNGTIVSYSYTREYSLSKNLIAFNPQKCKSDILEFIHIPDYLNSTKKSSIESYLSIKYGISLESDKSYISSKSDTLWSSKENAGYNNSVTAIGRDDYYNLKQTHAHNAVFNKLIIGVSDLKKDILIDNQYLFWGDNGESLEFEELEDIQILKRKWKLAKTINSESDIDVKICINPHTFIEDYTNIVNQEQKIVVLLSNSEKFEKSQIKFIEFEKVNGNYFVFDKLKLFSDLSEYTFFTFGIVPKFTVIENRNVECVTGLTSIQYKVIGGVSPYTFETVNLDNGKTSKVTFNENEFSYDFEKENHKYKYKIEDSSSNSFVSELNLENFQPIRVDLASEWLIGENELLISPTIYSCSECSYNWIFNGDLISEDSYVKVDSPGEYEFKVTSKFGCDQSYFFSVLAKNTSDSSVVLYPNPAKSGSYFTLGFNYSDSKNVKIHIYDNAGKIISFKEIDSITKHDFKTSLTVSGVYYIHINASGENQVKKIIIE